MIGRSHIVLGLACAVTAASADLVPLSLATLASAALGSLAPDIDSERSMLGYRLPWISRPLSRWVGHRTVTHSLVIPALLACLLVYTGGPAILHSAWGGFLIGYVSHILADLVTGGCWALYPLARGRLSFWPHARTGSFLEYVVLVCWLGMLGCVTYHYVARTMSVSVPHGSGAPHYAHSLLKHHVVFIA